MSENFKKKIISLDESPWNMSDTSRSILQLLVVSRQLSVILKRIVFVFFVFIFFEDPIGTQSPSENGFMEPKYYAFRRWLDTPIIWEYDWIPSYRMPKTSGPLKLFLFNRQNHDKFWDVRSETLRCFGVEGMDGLFSCWDSNNPKYWMACFCMYSEHAGDSD